MWRRPLENLRDSSRSVDRSLIPLLHKQERAVNLLKGREVHLLPSFELAEDLLTEMLTFNLVRWILEVDEDVLGAYFYPKQASLFRGQSESWIEIYWAVIGIVAASLPATTEDLTSVVLAHELAHAYTHKGFDIDGDDWDTDDFAGSDRQVKEGLAQYYTDRLCQRILRYSPGARDAYERLLKEQPATYRTHVPWVESYQPEHVRLALLQTRKRGRGTMEQFSRQLNGAKRGLTKGPLTEVET